MDLSIIIVSWNTRDLLAQCLDSIYAHPPHCEFEVWVVDNASSDGSAAMVREQFPQVRLIENKENLGFAAASNQSIQESTGRHVLLLNPDTLVPANTIERLAVFLDACPRAGAVGPRVLNPNGTLQFSCHPMLTLVREFWRLMHLDIISPRSIYYEEKWDMTIAHPVEVLQGSCLLIRRQALQEVGLLDPSFFMYTEEVELCYRILRGGWSIYWLPSVTITHYGGQSTSQASDRMFIELHRSKVLFFRKTRGVWGGRVYKVLLLLTALTRIAGARFGLRHRSEANQLSKLYSLLLLNLPSL
jgi:hypothetical protein